MRSAATSAERSGRTLCCRSATATCSTSPTVRARKWVSLFVGSLACDRANDRGGMPRRKAALESDDDTVDSMSPQPKKQQAGTKRAKKEEVEGAAEVVRQAYVDDMGWNIHPPSLMYRDFGTRPNSKIAAFDMDGTLISIKSSLRYPRNAEDWIWYNKKVTKTVKSYHDNDFKIVIFSNQGGVKSKLEGIGAANLKKKVEYMLGELQIPVQIFFATQDDQYRKPEVGMWNFMCSNCNGGIAADMKRSFFVGDAAGRPLDFAESDKQFAANVGVPFRTPDDVFGEPVKKREIPANQASNGEEKNAELVKVFARLHEHYSSQGEMFKARAYENVAKILRNYPERVDLNNLKNVGKLQGVGKASVDKIKEFLTTGKCAQLEDLARSTENLDPAKNGKTETMALNFM